MPVLRGVSSGACAQVGGCQWVRVCVCVACAPGPVQGCRAAGLQGCKGLPVEAATVTLVQAHSETLLFVTQTACHAVRHATRTTPRFPLHGAMPPCLRVAGSPCGTGMHCVTLAGEDGRPGGGGEATLVRRSHWHDGVAAHSVGQTRVAHVATQAVGNHRAAIPASVQWEKHPCSGGDAERQPGVSACTSLAARLIPSPQTRHGHTHTHTYAASSLEEPRSWAKFTAQTRNRCGSMARVGVAEDNNG